MNLKELKQLAKLCRSVGISHYESGDLKFDLSPYDPVTEKKVAKKIKSAEDSAMEKIKNMTEEDLLLYSSGSFNDKDA